VQASILGIHHHPITTLSFVYSLMSATSLTTKILDFTFTIYVNTVECIVQLFSTFRHPSQKSKTDFYNWQRGESTVSYEKQFNLCRNGNGTMIFCSQS
jgi:hypothetical protein